MPCTIPFTDSQPHFRILYFMTLFFRLFEEFLMVGCLRLHRIKTFKLQSPIKSSQTIRMRRHVLKVLKNSCSLLCWKYVPCFLMNSFISLRANMTLNFYNFEGFSIGLLRTHPITRYWTNSMSQIRVSILSSISILNI